MGDDKDYTITIGSASQDIGGWSYTTPSIDTISTCTVN